jgi:siroheme synthase-like protein
MTGRALLPVFLDLAGRDVLLVGAGPVAASKLDALTRAEARVTVVAPTIHPAILGARVTIVQRAFDPRDVDGRALVVAAAPPAVNAQVKRAADARRVFVNAVDDPAHGNVFLGGVVRRGPVTVAISTGGRAPALARLLRETLDRLLPHDLAEWLTRAEGLRPRWRHDGVPMEARRGLLLDELVRMHAEEHRHG